MGEGGGGSSSGFINPGIGILKSWQGIVEIVLRGGAVILAIIAIIAGASCQSSLENFGDNSLPVSTDAAGGWLIFLSFWVIVYQLIVIVQRFLNVGIINNNITLFIIIDIILVAIGAAGYLAGAAALANYADSWREFQNTDDTIRSIIARVTNATAAAAFFGFMSMFWMIGLAVYIALGAFFFNWGPTKAKYTA